MNALAENRHSHYTTNQTKWAANAFKGMIPTYFQSYNYFRILEIHVNILYFLFFGPSVLNTSGEIATSWLLLIATGEFGMFIGHYAKESSDII